MKRHIENYAPQKITSYDRNLSEFTLYSIPMRLFRFGEKLKLTIEVYEKGAFNSGEPITSPLNREFEIEYAEAVKRFPDFFRQIETNLCEYLEVELDHYSVESWDINLTNLSIRASAKHNTKPKLTVQNATETIEDFETIKAQYPNMVLAYFGFGRTFAAMNDEKLALFT
jgi:hypothetical protein